MRRRLAPLLVLLAVLLFPQLALATLIHNQDDTAHTIKVVRGSGSVSAVVAAKKSLSVVCSSFPCTVKLGDESVVIRSASDDVIIRDGKLERVERVARSTAQ